MKEQSKKSKSPQQIIETHKEISFIDFPCYACHLPRTRTAASGCAGGWKWLSARESRWNYQGNLESSSSRGCFAVVEAEWDFHMNSKSMPGHDLHKTWAGKFVSWERRRWSRGIRRRRRGCLRGDPKNRKQMINYWGIFVNLVTLIPLGQIITSVLFLSTQHTWEIWAIIKRSYKLYIRFDELCSINKHNLLDVQIQEMAEAKINK